MKVFVAGHKGMVGSALVRALRGEPGCEIMTRTRDDLDLIDREAVLRVLQAERPDMVYLAAATVGGINANNQYPASFIYQNLAIECSVIDAAWAAGIPRLLFLGSSCIYPKASPQPMPEEALLQGPLEPTNEPYGIAKIAGIKLCESYNRQYGTDYRSVMPTNLFGPNDNFHPTDSHVIPGLIRRFHEAKMEGASYVTVWGSGRPRREFLHVDDMASACLHVMGLSREEFSRVTEPMRSHLNVGYGDDISIEHLAKLIAQVIGFQGEIRFDPAMPDGTPRKLLDCGRISRTGWQPCVSLREGLESTYKWFVEHASDARGVARTST